MRDSIQSLSIGMLLVMLAPCAVAGDVIVKGNRYPETVQVADKTLRLLGAGLREKWVFDVYTLGAYSESGACEGRALISANEVKYIRIDMLRYVSAGKMAEALDKAFRKNMPAPGAADLGIQIKAFLLNFRQDLAKGASIELTYVPGVGTTQKQNGTPAGGVTPGKGFADLLWSCYFSSNTCCPSLKTQIISNCSK
jgi:hypothetical protein